MKKTIKTAIIISSVIAYIFMIIVNILANALPINNLTTGDISEKYPSLFTPAGFAFSIWGLIYLLLLFFVIFQSGIAWKPEKNIPPDMLPAIRKYFIISSLANGLWIFAWHYLIIPLSLILMGVIFFCLMRICEKISSSGLALREYFFIRLPFSIYFGWISVAALANTMVFLVSIGLGPDNKYQIVLTILFIFAGVLLTGFFTVKNRDIAYGLVPLWAYSAILFKHLSPIFYAGRYIPIVVSLIISLISFIIIASFTAGKRLKKKA